MIAQEHDGGLFWTICDFEGWAYVNMTLDKIDYYTRTIAEH